MGHVLLGNPGIEQLALATALHRVCLREGERVTVVATDPVTHRCMRAQGLSPVALQAGRPIRLPRIPLEDFARRDVRCAGVADASPAALGRCTDALARRLGAVLRLFETMLPDLVVLFDARDGYGRMLDWVAREFRCEVLHLGDGLLPGTLQCDELGVDGDASTCERPALAYRDISADVGFLDDALAATLAGESLRTDGRSRPPVWAPDTLDTALALFDGLSHGRLRKALDRLGAWRRAAERAPTTTLVDPDPSGLPREPFVAALLQRPEDPRLRLDGGDQPHPDHEVVIATARRAALAIGGGSVPVVVVAPPGASGRLARDASASTTVVQVGAATAPIAAALAAAVVTVNHPHALVGILAGTPVLHFGRTPYGIPGVATRLGDRPLDAVLGDALGRSQPALRARFATRLLKDDHVWCPAEAPDANGVLGLLGAIRRHLAHDRSNAPEPGYRPGPTWPLVSRGTDVEA
ncbi:MAG: hypothetical protein IPM29_06390 [Planctomycetes bacterium]|nr:hypothetical protein [Planctomycetota bacterium]